MSKFKGVALQMIENWSFGYKNNLKLFSKTTTISLATKISAYQWVKSKKNYYIPSGEKYLIKKEDILIYKNHNHATFEDFIESQFGIWVVQMKDDNWQDAKCTCPHFFKNYSCKHSVGIAIRLKLYNPPPEAKNIQMHRKRKPGCPKKAQKALLIQ